MTRGGRPLPAPALMATLIAGLVAVPAGHTAPERPPLPPARPVIQEPDRESCRPEAIQRAFRQQMLPWADQPEAVQARLRQLQAELTGRSLRQCVAKGLLTPQQAREVAASLGLAVAPQPAPTAGEPSGSHARP